MKSNKAVIWSETFLSSQYQKQRNIKQNFFWQSQKLVSQSTINKISSVLHEKTFAKMRNFDGTIFNFKESISFSEK